jgi:hypothetical protein
MFMKMMAALFAVAMIFVLGLGMGFLAHRWSLFSQPSRDSDVLPAQVKNLRQLVTVKTRRFVAIVRQRLGTERAGHRGGRPAVAGGAERRFDRRGGPGNAEIDGIFLPIGLHGGGYLNKITPRWR